MSRAIIGIVGPASQPTEGDLEYAEQLGRLIAGQDWILLTGGRNAGVMHAASKGAEEAGGLVIGILPGSTKQDMSPHVNIPIITGMGSARNNINVLTADVVIACGIGLGTTSEIALALKAGKPVVLGSQPYDTRQFLEAFGTNRLYSSRSPAHAVELIQSLLSR